MALILCFILVLNIISIALTYYCLSDLEKKEKMIFIVVGVAVIYMATSFIYGLSTKEIELREVSEIGKNLITFLFVPINGIIILPIIAKSYSKYKMGSIAQDKFKVRVVLLTIVLAIILVIECSYFKNVQKGVVQLVEDSRQVQNNKLPENINSNTEKTNQIQNETNIINSNEIVNVVNNSL